MIINSESLLLDVERHFKISAGPGAGKTYWLVNHIRNVLQRSARLSKTRRIACITYSNIGVESILKELGIKSNQVEVSTIHSFLYKHIVKPYCFFIPEEYELNIDKLDGHHEPFVDFRKVIRWINTHPRKEHLKHPYTINQLIKMKANRVALINWLDSLYYKLDDYKKPIITGRRSKAFFSNGKEKPTYLSNECLETLEFNLLDYKKLYWREGAIDHNDVIFFGYQLIRSYPFILTILQAKFPYFFIDEFQDTDPIQVEVVKKIGQKETIVGVIGDRAQSIYGFQGANPEQFTYFYLPGLIEFTMDNNRRSTNRIIDVLNHIRKDVEQKKYRGMGGDKPVILVGECKKSYEKVKASYNMVYSLSRKNESANAMKDEFENIMVNGNILDQLRAADSNSDRCNRIISCIYAAELARNGQYKEALKKIKFLAKDADDIREGEKQIIKSLYLLLTKYDTYKDKSLRTFCDFVKKSIDSSLAGFRRGQGPDSFYSGTMYKQLAIGISTENFKSMHRTIHKAKGAEFENVMLVLTGEKELSFLLNPDLPKNEEHRIYYVALSRARDKLFINVPQLSEKNKTKLESLFDINYI